MVCAIALLSGGLDSILAVRLMQEQGITVVGISFTSPFCRAPNGENAARRLGIEHIYIDFAAAQFALVKKPPHGFGSQMNPCIDCHALMMQLAGEEMRRRGADFIITGEVLGQRPFSQKYKALERVVEYSGLQGLILRPLSALVLEPTIPEIDGRVDRSKLLDIQGRTRARQTELALKYGIDFAEPSAGGCKLTEPNFAYRLKEALKDNPDYPTDMLNLLTMGRHFRLAPQVRLLVGKDEPDNNRMEAAAQPPFTLLQSQKEPGALGMILSEATEEQIDTACRIVGRYTDVAYGDPCEIAIWKPGEGTKRMVKTVPFSPDESNAYLISMLKEN